MPLCKSPSIRLRGITGFLALSAILPFTAYSAARHYHVLDHWKIGGAGGWDYMTMDSTMHRLYLVHNTSVDVVDTTTGKKVGAIEGLGGGHGVALDPADKRGYISDGRGNQIIIFDPHTLAKIAAVPAGTNPDGITYEPVTKTVWAFNGRSSDATVLDTATQKVVATIKLPGKPEFPVADGRGFVYDNIESKNEIVKLDAHTNQVVAEFPLTGCDSPSGLAIDRKGRKLFSVCDNKVMAVTSTDSGKVLATVPIGEGPDADRYDARLGLAFSSNGETGDMTVVDTRGATPHGIETVKTEPGARTMALDEHTGRVYTVTAQFGPKPAMSAENPHGRPPIVPDSFEVIVVGP